MHRLVDTAPPITRPHHRRRTRRIPAVTDNSESRSTIFSKRCHRIRLLFVWLFIFEARSRPKTLKTLNLAAEKLGASHLETVRRLVGDNADGQTGEEVFWAFGDLGLCTVSCDNSVPVQLSRQVWPVREARLGELKRKFRFPRCVQKRQRDFFEPVPERRYRAAWIFIRKTCTGARSSQPCGVQDTLHQHVRQSQILRLTYIGRSQP
ncbi:hypothetical protein B0G84_8565 [Paraburkholderia sp. BL8N3]|nr:hypothetical protein B0G84_8565 [Paraburkholderia sp. BL8N3]